MYFFVIPTVRLQKSTKIKINRSGRGFHVFENSRLQKFSAVGSCQGEVVHLYSMDRDNNGRHVSSRTVFTFTERWSCLTLRNVCSLVYVGAVALYRNDFFFPDYFSRRFKPKRLRTTHFIFIWIVAGIKQEMSVFTSFRSPVE